MNAKQGPEDLDESNETIEDVAESVSKVPGYCEGYRTDNGC